MSRVAVVTVGRSDWGLLRPVARRLAEEPGMELSLIVAGGHLSDELGRTESEIEADGFRIAARVRTLSDTDDAHSVARALALGQASFADAYAAHRPDVVLLLGDRLEVHAAAAAAVPFRIPVAHVHGGEVTEGALDELLRHSVTKLAHLHFAATDDAARRIVQLGEEPWRVAVTGAPGLDNLLDNEALSDGELAESCGGLTPGARTLLVTFHPVTQEPERTEAQVEELFAALAESGCDLVFTYPNADPGGRRVLALVRSFVGRQDNATLVASLGTRAYLSLLGRVGAMVGNSSSGIIEAASFALPVVNIGSRQQGRLRAANVIDVRPVRKEIAAAIERALSPGFRESLGDLSNPYGDGHASERIVARLREVPLDERLLVKRFHDLREAGA